MTDISALGPLQPDVESHGSLRASIKARWLDLSTDCQDKKDDYSSTHNLRLGSTTTEYIKEGETTNFLSLPHVWSGKMDEDSELRL